MIILANWSSSLVYASELFIGMPKIHWTQWTDAEHSTTTRKCY